MSGFWVFMQMVQVFSVSILIGAALAIAVFVWMAHRTKQLSTQCFVARAAFVAELSLTFPAALLVVISTLMLARQEGHGFSEFWLVALAWVDVAVFALWLVSLVCFYRMQQLLKQAITKKQTLPLRYRFWYRVWFWHIPPAALGITALLWLAIAKPASFAAIGV